MSRFAKVAGEMVPLETVETRMVESLALSSEGERIIAVTAVADESKGEALVVLTTRELDAKLVREKLLETGLSNLWIPKRFIVVEKIPILASGKLDIQGCRVLAEKSAKG
jgi:acyl-[acyl-carrier-protein]-phospholipid O-acyltransferase/long-chain-fatty-acid--[acyl-carrier-protein] ligase